MADISLAKLKQSGRRSTPLRTVLLSLFEHGTHPQSAAELQQKIAKQGLKINKTTLYRQLDTLLEHGIIREIHLDDEVMRFELVRPGDHHHHLVCRGCRTIQDVDFDDGTSEAKKLAERTFGFVTLEHRLEFFGYCKTCAPRYLKNSSS